MNANRAIWIVVVLSVILTDECRANLNGNDDFNDNSKDTSRWGSDIVVGGVGVFTETNQRLELTTSGAVTASDIIARPWVLNSGSYTQNWEMQIDVNVPFLTETNGQQVFFGLATTVGTAFTNRLLIEFGQSTDRHFRAFFATNNFKLTNVFAQTVTTSAAVRVAFDANTKVLSCYYDEDGPSCGYSWTLLRSEPVGTSWGLNNSSVFNVSVIGDCSLTPLSSGSNVYGDNFRASSGDNPSLQIKTTGNKAVLSWATNGPTTHLESTSTLSPPICWQSVTNTPGIVSTNFTVTNTISSVNTFFRLSR